MLVKLFLKLACKSIYSYHDALIVAKLTLSLIIKNSFTFNTSSTTYIIYYLIKIMDLDYNQLI